MRILRVYFRYSRLTKGRWENITYRPKERAEIGSYLSYQRSCTKRCGTLFFFFFKDQTSNLTVLSSCPPCCAQLAKLQFLLNPGICLLLNAAEVTQLQIGALYTIYIPGHQAHMNPVSNVSSIPTPKSFPLFLS